MDSKFLEKNDVLDSLIASDRRHFVSVMSRVEGGEGKDKFLETSLVNVTEGEAMATYSNVMVGTSQQTWQLVVPVKKLAETPWTG